MQRQVCSGVVLGLACAAFAASAGAQGVFDDDPYSDYDDVYFDDDEEADTGDDGDPWKGMNRAFFSFNEGLDKWLLKPVAVGWDFVLPHFAQDSIRNAFDNIQFPIQFTNNLLQGKPRDAGRDIGRFLVNSTVGIGGLLDPASTIGLTASNEDFGQTLGVWGVPPGPYLMLPVFGPSNIRDTAGLGVDSSMNVASYFMPFYGSIIMTTTNSVNRRSLVLGELEAERRAAIDFYEAVRSAYMQYRVGVIKDRGDADPGSYGLVNRGRREIQP